MTASFNATPTSGTAPLTVTFTDTSSSVAVDPSYDFVTLLMHFDGANGGTTFTDSSSYNTNTSSIGTPTTSSTQVKFGPTSLFCKPNISNPGSVYVNNPGTQFIFPNDFTIECWVYHIPGTWAVQGTIMRKDFSLTGGYWLLRVMPDGFYHFDASGTGVGLGITSTTPFSTYDNQWVNLAICRSGSTVTLFINGVPNATSTAVGTVGSYSDTVDGGQMRISESSGSEYWTGYIDEVRITKGIARYTSAYTPATSPFPNSATSSVTYPTAWSWNFGDSVTSTLQNPVHTYSTPGSFNAVLTATIGGNLVVSSPTTITTTQGAFMGQKVKIQDATINYSSADPTLALDFNVAGSINVWGINSPVDGVIASPDATVLNSKRLDITTGTNSTLNIYENATGGSLYLNNAQWPPGTTQPHPGMFLGVSNVNKLAYYPFILGNNASDTLTAANLNALYPAAQPAQCVLGPTVMYYSLGASQWRKISAPPLA